MFIIEDYPLNNPYYHSANDTLDTLNLAFHYEVTRALVAAIAYIADFDTDSDGIGGEDNCPNHPNGPALGYCAQTECFTFRYQTKQCTSDDDCVGSCITCLKNQEDNYPPGGNGIGDICEGWCYADLDGSGDVYPGDALIMLAEWGREDCLTNPPCEADIDGDGLVYPSDAMIMLEQWGKEDCPIIP